VYGINASGDETCEKSTKKGRAPMKPIKKGLASGNRGGALAPIQNLLQGRLLFLTPPLSDDLSFSGIDLQLFPFVIVQRSETRMSTKKKDLYNVLPL
jgi:hypothetical protein